MCVRVVPSGWHQVRGDICATCVHKHYAISTCQCNRSATRLPVVYSSASARCSTAPTTRVCPGRCDCTKTRTNKVFTTPLSPARAQATKAGRLWSRWRGAKQLQCNRNRQIIVMHLYIVLLRLNTRTVPMKANMSLFSLSLLQHKYKR